MAATFTAAFTNLPAKRKRAQISYAELDDERFDSAYESGPNDEEQDGHSTYGSEKKSNKSTKIQVNKKAKPNPPKSKKSSKPFPFLSLPAELRDYIYELALTDGGGLAIVSKTKAFRRTIARGFISDGDGWHYHFNGHRRRDVYDADGGMRDTYNTLAPNLLAVNKQIHAEAIGYLYKQPLIFEDTMALHTFLAAIRPSNRLQLSELVIKGWGNGRGTHKAMNFCAMTILADCINLKSLNLDCNIGWFRSPQQLAGQIYRDGHYFLEAYGTANGGKDVGVKVLKLSNWNYDRDNWSRWRQSQSLPKLDEFKKQFQAELTRLLMSADERMVKVQRGRRKR